MTDRSGPPYGEGTASAASPAEAPALPPAAPAKASCPEPEIVVLDELDARAVALVRGALAESTWIAYESDWRIFRRWCASTGLEPLPATSATVARFLADQARPDVERPAGLAPATIARRLAAIRKVHLRDGHPSPCEAEAIGDLLRGIRRRWRRPPARKAPLLDETVRAMVDTFDATTAAGLRDRALVLLGFAGAFRRSELVGLDVEDLERRPEGLRVTVARSKTDQEGAGQVVPVLARPGSRWCPIAALDAWTAVAGIDAGPLFRRLRRGGRVGTDGLSGRSVADILKRGAAALELDASSYSGHSLRRGFITQAARNGEDLFKIADVSRHRDLRTLMAYRHDESLFEDHAGRAMLGERDGDGETGRR